MKNNYIETKQKIEGNPLEKEKERNTFMFV